MELRIILKWAGCSGYDDALADMHGTIRFGRVSAPIDTDRLRLSMKGAVSLNFAPGMSLTTLEHPRAKVARTVRADAPAKINLTLEVLGRRDDGYHELRSLVIGVDLADHVHCQTSPVPGISLHCNDPDLNHGENLAARAARALADRCDHEPALRIELQKHIPVGGGLGGGSSDAATTLRLCDVLWETGLNEVELAAIGAELGSDVPLFFSLPSAVIEGRGERVSPVRLRWSGWVLLLCPPISVSTAEVYRVYRPDDSDGCPSGTDRDILHAASAAEVSELLSNHLETAVFRVCPAVYSLREALTFLDLTSVRVTGSGSALYCLFDDPEPALRAANKIQERWSQVTTVVASAPVGQGPIFSEEC